MLHILSANVRILDKPEFSWILEGDEDQSGYEIRINDAGGRIFWTVGRLQMAAGIIFHVIKLLEHGIMLSISGEMP